VSHGSIFDVMGSEVRVGPLVADLHLCLMEGIGCVLRSRMSNCSGFMAFGWRLACSLLPQSSPLQ
jgi:hypothetical protein